VDLSIRPLLLLLPFITAQYYPGLEGSSYCSTPANPGDLEMNFEATTSSATGKDSCTNDATTLKQAGTDPYCTSDTNCPLSDSVSGRVSGAGTTWFEDTSGSTFRDATLDFTFMYEAGIDTDFGPVVFIAASAASSACAFQMQPSENFIRSISKDGTTDDGSVALTAGVKYNIRLTMDGDLDICTSHADLASSGDWGEGGVDETSADGAQAAHDAVGWTALTNATIDLVYVVDDIGYCTGVSLGNAKCGRGSALD